MCAPKYYGEFTVYEKDYADPKDEVIAAASDQLYTYTFHIIDSIYERQM